MEPIIALTITDFVMFDELPNVLSYWHLRDKEQFIKYSDDLELLFIELPKFCKRDTELTTITDKWIYFIKHAGELDFIPKTFTEPPLLEAFDIDNTAGLSEEELDVQWKRRDFIRLQKGALAKAKKEGKEEGREEGRKHGEQAEKLALAKKSLEQGLHKSVISMITGLSIEELDAVEHDRG